MTTQVTQYDLMGNPITYKPKDKRRGIRTMQQMHGTKEGKICLNCANLVKFNHGVTVYKCLRWKFSSDPRNDINASQSACNKFHEY